MEKKKRKEWARSYAWSAPSLLLIGLMVVFPILYTFYISLTNMNVYHWFDFTLVGLDNYIRALFVFDSGFLSAPGYVGILLWKTGMFNTQFGLLNQWMDKLGLTAVKWLSSDVSAFLSCTVVNLWLALPFMIMIMDGALQSIDRSYYESAILDGAGAFARAKYITIPAMRPIIAPAVIITVFTTFKQFDVVYLLTQQAGAKTGSGFHTILTYAYENAFITNNYGYSSAISMIIFALLLLFSAKFQLKEDA